jgi:hypothetical protein
LPSTLEVLGNGRFGLKINLTSQVGNLLDEGKDTNHHLQGVASGYFLWFIAAGIFDGSDVE